MIVPQTLSIPISKPTNVQKQHRYEVESFSSSVFIYEIKMKRMQRRQHVRRRDVGKKGSRRKLPSDVGGVLCIIHIGEERTEINNVDRLSDWSGEKEGFDILTCIRIFTSKTIPFCSKNELLLFRKLLPFIVVLIRDWLLG